ncbi:MAG: hypothetical protein JW724_07155 [Candidatus Altiarchaeota archaeon]|nr:hypothetical protein [Candidatus Altiarchaeota archaeon]
MGKMKEGKILSGQTIRLAFLIILFAIVVEFLASGGNVIVKNGQLNISHDLYAGNSVLYVDAGGGRVGIGTVDPNMELAVAGDVNVTGTVYAHNFSGNSPIVFVNQSNGAELMRIDEGGDLQVSGGSIKTGNGATIPTCDATTRGATFMDTDPSDGFCVCIYSGSYYWEDLLTGTSGTSTDCVLPPCFAGDMLVSLYPEGLKSIEDLAEGDLVRSFDVAAGLSTVSRVVKVSTHDVGGYLLINDRLKVTSNHPMFINGEWTPIGEAEIGDRMLGVDGEEIEIYSVDQISENVRVYDLSLDGDHNYFVEGLLAHNK